jgi:uncharacterized protein GlcG (DUF336 family)
MANFQQGALAGPKLTGRRLPTILFPGSAAAQVADNERSEGGERMTIVKHSIDAKLAEKAVAAAATKAAEMKLKMCIAVVDEAGDLKAFLRMDGAPKLAIQIAQDKAYTAASFGMPTHAWFEFIKDDPPLLHGITHTPRLTVFGGGFPIKLGDEMIGAIGLSGGHYTQDMECARAALKAIGADPL